MKLKYFLSCLLIFTLFAGCKNFLKGSELIDDINNVVEYNNSKYLNIKILVDTDSCNSIIPAANIYSKDYKNKDIINLEFEEKSDYLFLYWNVTPKKAVVFENEKSKTTTAEINYTGSETITIEPVCAKKIKMNIFPDNNSVNPKNTPIVISYSEKMDIKKKDLNKIDIILNSTNEDIKKFYQSPVITFDDEGTKISFFPNRTNLLNITEKDKITVKVPDFNFIFNKETTIPFGSETAYTFEINNETVDKVQIEFSSYDNEGTLQIKNTKQYSLDETITNIFEPDDDYCIVDWQVLYDDNQKEVDPTILSYTVSENKKKIDISILCGTERKVIIKPVTVKYAKFQKYSVDEKNYEFISKEIYFTFNQDMRDFDLSLGNNKSIKVQNKVLEDLSDYFKITGFSDDGKTVIVKPNIFKYKNYLDDKKINEQDVFFTFTENIKNTKGKYEIPFKETDNSKVSVTYLNNYETQKPVIKINDVKRKTTSESSESLGSSIDLSFNVNNFTAEDITKNVYDLFYKNHVGNTIYLDVEASDADTGNSGIRRFIVYETLEKDNKNEDYFSPNGQKDEICDYYYYKKIYEGENLIQHQNENNTTLTTEIKLQTQLDGALKITVAAVDNSNNFITQSFYVILETGNNIDFDLFNNIPVEEIFYFSAMKKEGFGKDNFIDYYNENVRKVFIKFPGTQSGLSWTAYNNNYPRYNSIYPFYQCFSNYFYLQEDNMKITYSYYDDDNVEQTEKLTRRASNDKCYYEMLKYTEDGEDVDWEDYPSSGSYLYSFDIKNVKDLSNLEFTIKFEIDEIFSKDYTFTFPDKVTVFGKSGDELLIDSKNNEVGYLIVNDDYILATSNERKTTPVKIVEEYTHEYDAEQVGVSAEIQDLTIENPDYYPVGIFRQRKATSEEEDLFEEQFYLFGQIDIKNPITTSTLFEDNTIVTTPEIKTFNLTTNGKNSRKLKLEVEMKENYWELENPSSIYLEVQENKDKFYFERNKTKAEFIFDNSYFLLDNEDENLNFNLVISKENSSKKSINSKTISCLRHFDQHGANYCDINFKNYDCFPPFNFSSDKASQYDIGREYFSMAANDNIYHTASGIKKILIKINNIIEFDGFYKSNFNKFSLPYETFKIPLYDIEDGNYSVKFIAFDNSITENYLVESDNITLLYLPDYQFAKNIRRFSYNKETLDSFVIKNPELSDITTKLKGYILYWDAATNAWKQLSSDDINDDNDDKKVKNFSPSEDCYNCSFDNYQSQNCFIKTMCTYDTGEPQNIIFTSPQYYYIGNGADVKTKGILSNKEGLLVSSDKPVFVQTLVTSKSYDEAKKWNYDQWIKKHPSVSEEVINFSNEDKNVKIYNIDFNEIPEGYSYVSIAHFADDSIMMGDVYKKERD